MKLIKYFSIISLISTLSFAQTTMCFKQNYKDFSTLETVNLDGGKCDGKSSLQDMKKNGWKVDDIKIDGNNYIYILKKDEISITNVNMQELENKILKRLEQKNIEDNKKAIMEKRYNMSISGKKLYVEKCQSCHGEKGEVLPGFSRSLNNLNLEDFEITIRDYNNGSYDRGTAFPMLPYAKIMSKSDVKNVYVYLKSINQTSKKETPKN